MRRRQQLPPALKGGFAAIRNGLLAHMPILAQNPGASHVYLFCHLSTGLDRPRPGEVEFSVREVAKSWGWSRPRVQRALHWLCVNPSPEKPYLLRLNPSARGQLQRYFIRNYDGSDPGAYTARVVTPALPPCNASVTTSGPGGGNASVTTGDKVVTPHVTPALQPDTTYTRARSDFQTKKDKRDATLKQNGEKMSNEYDVPDPKIAHWFATETELREFARERFIHPGLSDELAGPILDGIAANPHRWGLAVRPTEGEADLELILDQAKREAQK